MKIENPVQSSYLMLIWKIVKINAVILRVLTDISAMMLPSGYKTKYC